MIFWSREWDLNPRPADYESAALPLCYLGKGGNAFALPTASNFSKFLLKKSKGFGIKNTEFYAIQRSISLFFKKPL